MLWDNQNSLYIYSMEIAGIYTISFTGSERIYIGSAMNISRRKSQHLYMLRRNIHSNSKLQNYYNKYGEVKFNFNVIECVLDNKEVRPREQYYLDQYYAQEYISSNFKDRRFDDLLLNINPEVDLMRVHWTEDRKKALIQRNKDFIWTDDMRKKSSEMRKGLTQSQDIKDKKRDIMKAKFINIKLSEGRCCPYCSSSDTTKLGQRMNYSKKVLMQRLRCNQCNKGYSEQVKATGC